MNTQRPDALSSPSPDWGSFEEKMPLPSRNQSPLLSSRAQQVISSFDNTVQSPLLSSRSIVIRLPASPTANKVVFSSLHYSLPPIPEDPQEEKRPDLSQAPPPAPKKPLEITFPAQGRQPLLELKRILKLFEETFPRDKLLQRAAPIEDEEQAQPAPEQSAPSADPLAEVETCLRRLELNVGLADRPATPVDPATAPRRASFPPPSPAPHIVRENNQVNPRAEAKRNLNKLGKSASSFAVLYSIHAWALGLEETEARAFYPIYSEIGQDAETQKISLWKAYYEKLGQNLPFFKRLKSRFWYFLLHRVNDISETARVVSENIFRSLQQTFISSGEIRGPEGLTKQEENLNVLLDDFLTVGAPFLEKWQQAIQKDAEERSIIHRQNILQDLLAILSEQLGEPINSLPELCTVCSNVLIDRWLPKELPFFKKVREVPIFGRFFSIILYPLRCLTEKWYLRKARELMPYIIQTVLEGGVDATTRLPFSIALVESTTNLLTGFYQSMNPPPGAEPEIPEDGDLPEPPLPAVKNKLPAFITAFLNLLPLLPPDAKHAETIEEFRTRVLGGLRTRVKRGTEELSFLQKGIQMARNLVGETLDLTPLERSQQIVKGVKDGASLLFRYLIKHPEVIDQLFNNIAILSNMPFERSLLPPYTQKDLELKEGALFSIGERLFSQIIDMGVDEFIAGPDLHKENKRLAFLLKEQLKACKPFDEIDALVQQIEENAEMDREIFLQLYDTVMELNKFHQMADNPIIDQMYDPVKEEIYRFYNPIYLLSIELANEILELERIQSKITNNQQLLDTYSNIQTFLLVDLQRGEIDFSAFEASLATLQEILPDKPDADHLQKGLGECQTIAKEVLEPKQLIRQIKNLERLLGDIRRNRVEIKTALSTPPLSRFKTELEVCIGHVQGAQAKGTDIRGPHAQLREKMQNLLTAAESVLTGKLQAVEKKRNELLKEEIATALSTYAEALDEQKKLLKGETVQLKNRLEEIKKAVAKIDFFDEQPSTASPENLPPAEVARPKKIPEAQHTRAHQWGNHWLARLTANQVAKNNIMLPYAMQIFKGANQFASMSEFYKAFGCIGMFLVIKAQRR
ncbi:MAG: hypothetical protein KGJ02_02840 [Verrucomicrobiota bacterium]|nr:hypothetical protein [Verrucomicrobiota bacterium]